MNDSGIKGVKGKVFFDRWIDNKILQYRYSS